LQKSDAPAFGQPEADLLLKREWAQGRIFNPDGVVVAPAEGVVYVVCTQSCSVVSASLEKDPCIELAEARPLHKYAPKCDEATGKNARRYHLPYEGADFAALEIDINRRRFEDRRLLLDRFPARGSISQKARRDFAAWLGRYYSRIDLPNAFVARLAEHFYSDLKRFLKGHGAADTVPRHQHIKTIYVKYGPDEELGEDASYQAEFIFMCEDGQLAEWIYGDMIHVFGERELTKPGLRLKFTVNSPEETFLSDLNDFYRFTDWDHLSGPWAAVASDKG
jgi:hypothetical protein